VNAPAQLDGCQLKRPASQRMAVMIDRGLVRPRSQQLARGVSHELRSVLVDVLSELEGLVGGREGLECRAL